MVFDQFNNALHDDTEVVAKEQLRRELNNISVGQCGDMLMYANSEGHGILARLDDQTQHAAKTEHKLAQQKG